MRLLGSRGDGDDRGAGRLRVAQTYTISSNRHSPDELSSGAKDSKRRGTPQNPPADQSGSRSWYEAGTRLHGADWRENTDRSSPIIMNGDLPNQNRANSAYPAPLVGTVASPRLCGRIPGFHPERPAA